jgi:hypothetical protein
MRSVWRLVKHCISIAFLSKLKTAQFLSTEEPILSNRVAAVDQSDVLFKILPAFLRTNGF